jgi:hypothetical protein
MHIANLKSSEACIARMIVVSAGSTAPAGGAGGRPVAFISPPGPVRAVSGLAFRLALRCFFWAMCCCIGCPGVRPWVLGYSGGKRPAGVGRGRGGATESNFYDRR